jgi:small nuclear ribonucleoprotein (snRNP)-like protein
MKGDLKKFKNKQVEITLQDVFDRNRIQGKLTALDNYGLELLDAKGKINFVVYTSIAAVREL